MRNGRNAGKWKLLCASRSRVNTSGMGTGLSPSSLKKKCSLMSSNGSAMTKFSSHRITRIGTVSFLVPYRPFVNAKTFQILRKKESCAKTPNAFTAGLEMGKRSFLLVTFLYVLTVAAVASAVAGEAPRKVRMAFTSLSGSMIPPWIAREAGLFAKHGLEVEVIATPSGVEGMNALIAGELQF